MRLVPDALHNKFHFLFCRERTLFIAYKNRKIFLVFFTSYSYRDRLEILLDFRCFADFNFRTPSEAIFPAKNITLYRARRISSRRSFSFV